MTPLTPTLRATALHLCPMDGAVTYHAPVGLLSHPSPALAAAYVVQQGGRRVCPRCHGGGLCENSTGPYTCRECLGHGYLGSYVARILCVGSSYNGGDGLSTAEHDRLLAEARAALAL